MKKENIRKILVINFGGIGDEILFLPTLISLKKEFKHSQITVALEPRSKGIKDLTDTIDDLILVDVKSKSKYSELLKLVYKARAGGFDLVVSSGGNKLISVLLFLMGIKYRFGYDTGGLSRILLTGVSKLNKNQYACGMYHDLITGITQHKTELPQIRVAHLPKEFNSVLIHPGVSKLSVAQGMIKTIKPLEWARVIELLIERGKKVILAGGPDDKECIEEIGAYLAEKNLSNFSDMYGRTKSLQDLAELIGSCEKFVCSDSAPLHIAVALKTKTYVVFGPTDDKKLIPQNDDVIALKANDDCPIKPCLWERRQKTCEALSCLKLSPEKIVEKILEN